MTNPFYARSFNLVDHVDDASATPVRNEFALLEAAFDLFPALTGNAGKFLAVNATEDAIEAVNPSAASALLEDPGYYVLKGTPDDLIIQWGTATSNSSGVISASFATTFPNAVLAGFICSDNSASWSLGTKLQVWGIDLASTTTSTLKADGRDITSSTIVVANAKTCSYIVLGY